MTDRRKEPATERPLVDFAHSLGVTEVNLRRMLARFDAKIVWREALPAPLDVERMTDFYHWLHYAEEGNELSPEQCMKVDRTFVEAFLSEPSTEPPASLAAAYPTIDYGRLTEIIEEVTELAQSDELLFVDEDGRGMFRGRVPTEPAQGGE